MLFVLILDLQRLGKKTKQLVFGGIIEIGAKIMPCKSEQI